MKKCICLVLICMCLFIIQIKAQNFEGKKNAVTSHTLLLDDALMRQGIDLEKFSEREKKLFSQAKERLKQQLLDGSYDKIKKYLNEKHSLALIDKDAMRGTLPYGSAGYPNVLFVKKAAKKADADHYLILSGNFSNDVSIGKALLSDLSSPSIMPAYQITINITDCAGKKRYKATGKYSVAKAIKTMDMGAGIFDILTNEGIDALSNTLLECVDPALIDFGSKVEFK